MPRDFGKLTLYQLRMLICNEDELQSHRKVTASEMKSLREERARRKKQKGRGG